jgi:hypothetical protein
LAEDTPVVTRAQEQAFEGLAEKLEHTTLWPAKTPIMSVAAATTITQTQDEPTLSQLLQQLAWQKMSSYVPRWEENLQEITQAYHQAMEEDRRAREIQEDPGGPGDPGDREDQEESHTESWEEPMVPGPNMPRGGGWCGKEPPIFDGDRKKSKDFMDDFDLYIGLNKGMVQASNPSQRVYMCLNLVRGEKSKNGEQPKWLRLRAW